MHENVKLVAKTRWGKSRLAKSKTDIFRVLKREERVLFTSDQGPWLLCEAVDDRKDTRWVHETWDVNFQVVKM